MSPVAPIFVRTVLLPCQGIVSMDAVEDALLTASTPTGDLVRVRLLPARGPGWFLGEPSIVLRWSDGLDAAPLSGHPPITVLVDVVPRRIPLAPEEEGDLAAAWALGAFGAGTASGALLRSIEGGGPTARDVVEQHDSFLRVRLTYALGAAGVADPAGRQMAQELAVLMSVARPLVDIPEVRGWFHGPGEVLRMPAEVRAAIRHAKEDKRLPIELWTSVRAMSVDEAGWCVVDSVGMAALGNRDLEWWIAPGTVPASDAALFLRNLTLYAISEPVDFKTGHTAASPAGHIEAKLLGRGFRAPQRRVVRWTATAGPALPDGMR